MKKFYYLLSLVLALVSLSAFKPHAALAGDCGGPYPPKPAKVWAKSGPGSGEVTLYWDEVPYANRYAVAYGTESGKYLYGGDNIGGQMSRSYTVKYLSPGTKYYFRLAAARDCTSSPFSEEVSSYAAGGQVYQPKAEAPTVPAQTYAPQPVKQTWIKAMSGPAVGEVTLNWSHREDVDNYHLVYGTMAGKYEYGALNIGKVTSFTVSKLVAGKLYYFALVPVKGDRALYTSDPVIAYAKSMPVEVVQTSLQSLLQPVEDQSEKISLEYSEPPVGEPQEEVMGVTDVDLEINEDGTTTVEDRENIDPQVLEQIETEGYTPEEY